MTESSGAAIKDGLGSQIEVRDIVPEAVEAKARSVPWRTIGIVSLVLLVLASISIGVAVPLVLRRNSSASRSASSVSSGDDVMNSSFTLCNDGFVQPLASACPNQADTLFGQYKDNVFWSDNSSLVKVQTDTAEPAATISPTKTTWVDQFLSDYVKFISSASNTERSLKLLQWTLWLASYMTQSQGLKKLSLDLSYARYAFRLLGLPASMEAARNGSWKASKAPQWLGQVMAWSMIGYYPMEHVAYVRWQAPQLLPQQNAERWSAWSCRCWLLYIVADVTQSAFKLKSLLKERFSLKAVVYATHDENQDSSADEKQSKEKSLALMALNGLIRNEHLQIVRSLLFTLPAIHWSLPRRSTHPWLKEGVVNGLMLAEAVVSMYQSVASFQR